MCKGDRCGHNKAWNKELGSAVLKKRKRKEEERKYMSKSEDTEDNEDEEEKVKRGQLKFPKKCYHPVSSCQSSPQVSKNQRD